MDQAIRRIVFKTINDFSGPSESGQSTTESKAEQKEIEKLRALINTAPEADSAATRVIVMESVPNGAQEYIVLATEDPTAPETESSHLVGIWHVRSGSNPSVSAALKLQQEDVRGVRQGPLRNFVAGLAEQQSKYLKPQSPATT